MICSRAHLINADVVIEDIARVTVTIAEILGAIACVIEVTWIEIHGDLRWVQRLWRVVLLREAKVD